MSDFGLAVRAETTEHQDDAITAVGYYLIFQASVCPKAALPCLGLSNRSSSDRKAQVPKKPSKLALRSKKGRDESLSCC